MTAVDLERKDETKVRTAAFLLTWRERVEINKTKFLILHFVLLDSLFLELTGWENRRVCERVYYCLVWCSFHCAD